MPAEEGVEDARVIVLYRDAFLDPRAFRDVESALVGRKILRLLISQLQAAGHAHG